MMYEKMVLKIGKDELIEFIEEILGEWNLKYIRSPNEYRISIYPKKQKWRPFGFFLGYGFRSLPNSPIVDIILLEGEEEYTEVVFRIVRGFEGIARKIVIELNNKYK